MARVHPVSRGLPRTAYEALHGPRLYTLDEEHHPYGTFDVLAWARWIDASDGRRGLLAHDLGDGIRVSTVFVGIDRDWPHEGPPLLWQTIISGGAHDGYERHYSSHDESRVGHAIALDVASGKSGNGHGG